jgi:uncharacterized membrane protein
MTHSTTPGATEARPHPRPHRHPHLRTAIARARRRRRGGGAAARLGAMPLGARLADVVAALVGSWPFIVVQTALLLAWITANAAFGRAAWDPYPFILLNLLLSFQAAYTAPIIMMSQNRQADVDRGRAVADYQVNLRAEAEIALLHEKVDLLREREIVELTELLRATLHRLDRLEQEGRAAPPA